MLNSFLEKEVLELMLLLGICMSFMGWDNLIYSILGLSLGVAVAVYIRRKKIEAGDLQEFGRALGALLQLHKEIRLIKGNLDAIAAISRNTTHFEAVRQYTLKKFTRRDETFKKNINFACIVIAKYLPVTLFAFENVLKSYEAFQNANFEQDAKSSDTYILKLTSLGNSFSQHSHTLTKIIKALARKHSVLTWFKVNKELSQIAQKYSFSRVKKSDIHSHLKDYYWSQSGQDRNLIKERDSV